MQIKEYKKPKELDKMNDASNKHFIYKDAAS
jgi:hypothetical protein